MMSTPVLWPAYGRRYAHVNDVVKDWLAEKDFSYQKQTYCSIRDFQVGDRVYLKWGSKNQFIKEVIK